MTDVASAVSGVTLGPDKPEKAIKTPSDERQEDRSALKKSMTETDNLEVPKYPVMQDMPKPETTPMNGWGGAASFIATFGAMLTRRPLQNALNANADVMEAVRNQDMTKFKNSWDAAKLANDDAIKAANWQLDMYKTLVNKKESEQKIILGSLKDDTGEKALLARQFVAHTANFEKQVKQLESNNAVTYAEDKVDDYRKIHPEATEEEMLHVRAEAMGEWQNTVKGKTATGENKKEAEDALAKFDWKTAKPDDVVPGTGLTVASVQQYGRDVHAGAKPSSLGLGYSLGLPKKAVENYVSWKYPGFSMAKAQMDYVGALKEEVINAARTQQAKIAVKEIDKLSPPMVEAVKKLDSSQYPDWNSIVNAYEKKVGDPDVIKAYAAVQEFKTAFGNLMVRTGATTDMVRSKADELASMNFSLNQVEALSEQAKISGAAIVDSLKEAKDEIGGDSGGRKSADQERGAMPLPKDAPKSDPDGTRYPDHTGKIWVKKGDQLIPE